MTALGFDRVVMVDWSANSGPKTGTNSIWVADGDASGALSSRNYATRCQAHSAVLLAIDRSLVGGERALVGYDFSLGYPAGFGAYFSGPARPWERIWEHMEANLSDTDTNMSNRFEVANDINAATAVAFYWGSPVPWPALAPRLKTAPRSARKPAGHVPTYRVDGFRPGEEGYQEWLAAGERRFGGLPGDHGASLFAAPAPALPAGAGSVATRDRLRRRPARPAPGSRWYWRKSGPRRSCRPTGGRQGRGTSALGGPALSAAAAGPGGVAGLVQPRLGQRDAARFRRIGR